MMKDDIPAAAATAVVGANIAEAGGRISNPLTLFLLERVLDLERDLCSDLRHL